MDPAHGQGNLKAGGGGGGQRRRLWGTGAEAAHSRMCVAEALLSGQPCRWALHATSQQHQSPQARAAAPPPTCSMKGLAARPLALRCRCHSGPMAASYFSTVLTCISVVASTCIKHRAAVELPATAVMLDGLRWSSLPPL